MKTKILSMSFAVGLAAASMLHAAEVEPRIQSSALSFTGGSGFTNATLQINGPDDFQAEETASRGLPVFRVQGGKMRDGFYHFILSAATDEKVKIKRPIDNGRGDDARDHTFKPFHMSGMFEVRKGRILPPEEMAAGADGDSEESK